MKAKQIKEILTKSDILVGVNMFPGEPTKDVHSVGVRHGKKDEAIAAITKAGGKSWGVTGCSNLYAEYIYVARNEQSWTERKG